jgi:hypothetical protein
MSRLEAPVRRGRLDLRETKALRELREYKVQLGLLVPLGRPARRVRKEMRD